MAVLLLFQMVTRTKKIFVGGLSATTTLEEVRAYFERFGDVSNFFKFLIYSDWIYFQIEDAMLMHDKQTNRHRYEKNIILLRFDIIDVSGGLDL